MIKNGVIVLLIIILFIVYFIFNARVFGQWYDDCPAGQYPIGREGEQLICRDTPTGCINGDSLSLDNPKCGSEIQSPNIEPIEGK